MQASQYFQDLSDYRALVPYALLGLVAGLLSAAAVLAFEWQIEALGYLWLGAGSPDGFEALPAWQRFVIPLAAAAVLGIVFGALKPEDRETGIVHVLSRMHSHYGQLPLRNALVQFFGGAVALAGGHSGGREGPGVQLGAAISSWLSLWLQLPNNSQRILIACGTAGSIAAAFNTPLAGVVFAMEVIVAEYTVIGFTPVLVAAISATTLSQALGGGFSGFAIPELGLTSLLELPLILLLGIAAGVAAGAFAWLLNLCLRAGRLPPLVRFLMAGLLTGSLGLVVPEVLGLGYDSLALAVQGGIGPLALGMLLGAKLLATSVTVGLGLPVGVIGPSLIIGSCVGGLVGFAGIAVLPEYSSDLSLYIVIGMGAGMAAMLNAPLAALLAVVELTGNVSVVFPTMLAIVAATLTTTAGLRARSAHRTVLRFLQRAIPEDAISQLLHQTNVLTAMDRSVRALNHGLGREDYPLETPPNWCLLKREEEYLFLVRGTEVTDLMSPLAEEARIDLMEQDLRRWSITRVSPRATLREALDAMRREDAEAAVVMDKRVAGDLGIRGVLTRDIIDQFYLMRL
jgi:H+/Cl- antiporter ClcA